MPLASWSAIRSKIEISELEQQTLSQLGLPNSKRLVPPPVAGNCATGAGQNSGIFTGRNDGA
jgi:hypothetical protein